MDPKIILFHMKNRFDRVYSTVEHDHKKCAPMGGAHDFMHALLVAQEAHMCAIEEGYTLKIAELSWLAGLLHNADHIAGNASMGTEMAVVDRWLDVVTSLTQQEITRVRNAVIVHKTTNVPEDDPILICLQDADRLASLGVDLLARSARVFPGIPIVNWDLCPRSMGNERYGNPTDLWADLMFALEWADPSNIRVGVRTKRAKRIARKRAVLLKKIIEGLTSPYEEAGLV